MKKGPRARTDMNYRPERQDICRNQGKWRAPTVCTGCGAVFAQGRWTWRQPPAGAARAVCPACQRISDNYPAGTVQITGAFFRIHRDEMERLIRHEEEAEKKDHALERIMTVHDEGDRTLITTTGIHLARRIGESLARAYQGELAYSYGDAEKTIRVYWSRE